MSEQLLANIYTKLKNFNEPVSNKPLDQHNSNLSVVCKNGHVNIALNIDPKEKDEYENLSTQIKDSLKDISQLLSVNVVLTSEKVTNNINSPKKENTNPKINAKKIIAISSGKGGVGKSTFAVNIAVALSLQNKKVGLLDADIYGPSIPRMMGINEKPQTNQNKKLIPLENFNIKCMSIGFLIDVDTPTIWRGPMVMKAVEQMLFSVEWGDLDYLIIDLPPGTGDVQITLAQKTQLSGSIIISTPQDIALIDARKGINMFKKVDVPVLGIVENMSYFICTNCNTKHEIFSTGGAKSEAKKYQTDFLGELPLDTNLRKYSDEGLPICIAEPESDLSKLYLNIAEKIHRFDH